MTIFLAAVGLMAVSFSAGWRAASQFQVSDREAKRVLAFELRSPIEAVILAEAAPR